MLENSNLILQYSPVIMLVLVYFLQFKIFVTPEILEKKHREILMEAENRFASRVAVHGIKEQMAEIKEKIDKIYNCFLTGGEK